jgi:hypothetical protein
MEAGINYRSDAPRPRHCGIRWTRRVWPMRRRPRRKLLRKRLSLHGRSGRRWVASRNQKNWFAAIAGAMTWLRVLSSGGIADAASVLVNTTDQRHGRGRRRSRNSFATTCDTRDRARKGSALFRLGLWCESTALGRGSHKRHSPRPPASRSVLRLPRQRSPG